MTDTGSLAEAYLQQSPACHWIHSADGRFVAFLASGSSYRFVYEMPAPPFTHGAVIVTRDNILAVTTIAPGSGGGVEQATFLTGTVNDLLLAPGCTVLYCQGASPLTITGLAGGVPGQRVTIIPSGPPVTLPYMSASSLAGNRLLNWASTAPTVLAPSNVSIAAATYLYDGTNLRWNLVAHEQGAWITPPFNAADFTALGGGTWTVTAPQVTLLKYRLSGRTLALVFQIAPSTVAGAVTGLVIGNNQLGGHRLSSGGSFQLGYSTDPGLPFVTATNDTQIVIQRGAGGAFTPSAGFVAYGTWFGEVL